MPTHPTQVVTEIFAAKYPDAKVIFLAGSIVRGEGTSFSDLDLVVVFEYLPVAYRESFYFEGYPVEAFVHDPETLNYFFCEVDRPSGIPALAQMIAEGIEVPQPNALSRTLKDLATAVIDLGPPKLSEEDVRKLRYDITNLVDDIREPRSKAELVGTGTQLYEALANHYFRSNNLWSAKGKSISRILQQADKDLCARYLNAFEELFVVGRTESVIWLAEEILKPSGGFLFEGHRLEAPENYRKPLV